MATQSLVWTTLPNGVADGGKSLRVSILLSPRLDAQNDPQALQSFFPDWEVWPKTLTNATVTVSYGAASVSVPVSQTSGPNRIDTSIGAPDPAAWKAIFHGGLFVRGFQFQDRSGDHVVSYDTVAVESLVSGLYRELARSADGEMPKVSDLVDRPTWRTLIGAVAELDRLAFDRKAGRRDPGRLLDRLRQHELPREGPAAALAPFELFHTPPSRPKQVHHTRQDDPRIETKSLEYERTPLPAPTELGKRLDFHQVVAAMNQYPTLLRRLGLVLDLVLERSLFADTPDDALWTQVDFAPALSVPTTNAVSPVTHARLSRRVFAAVPNPTPGADELRVEDGLLLLDPERFALLQMDVDGAGLKLMNFARSLARVEPTERRVDSVTRREFEPGAPALTTAGLMLVHRQRGASLAARFAGNKLKNTAAEQVAQGAPGAVPPDLWAEDLVRGFRFDVWNEAQGVWRSLCQRHAVYELDGGAVVVTVDPHEEGTVRLAATRSPDPTYNADVVHLHEAVTSWTGWSLAAPPPGRAILPDDSVDNATVETEAELPPGVRVRTRFKALPGSLPRLRFGRRYWMRGRVVDLAGNSLPPRENDYGPEDPAGNARRFLRYEPLKPPVVALVRRKDGVTERPAEGESMERIAIRSFNDTPADNTVPTAEIGRRFAVPPQASVRDAEQHGMLDDAGKVDATTFDLLANQKDLDATHPNAAMVEERIPMQGPLDPTPVDTVFAVYRDGEDLTYLPDALTNVVAARVIGHPNISSSTLIEIPLYPGAGRAWPDAVPFKILVREDQNAAPFYDAASHTLVVDLPKGVRARVRLSVRPTKEALRLLGAWSWLSDADQQQLESLALAGRHWMLTPWRTIEVVHATQRPLITPEILFHTLSRGLGSTSVQVRLTSTCSIKSTDRMDLLAQWHEPSDDPEATESEALAVDRDRGDVAFSIKITGEDDYAVRSAENPAGGFPDHTIVAEDEIGVGIPARDLDPPKHHEFHDTRYRRIEYWFDATTRFREFLPHDVLTEPVADEDVQTEKNIRVTGPRTVTWIKSSAPPLPPEILYVIPTFGWERAVGDQGTVTSWRRGGGLRVYLDRPWMVSGYGEMLAVVLPPASFGGDPEKEPASAPYKKYVTQWANDPIWASPFVSGVAPKRGDFPLARTAPDPDGKWLPYNAPITERDQPPGAFQVTGLLPPNVTTWSGAALEIAPHDVHYDETRRLWYCDIEIDQGSSYYPFVRLALARYQPSSIHGAHLSSVVLADFMSLAAGRWLHVHPTDDPRTRRVSVHGRSYYDSSGWLEASRSPSFSLVNPLTGEVRTVEPAAVSGQSVIEVWVERLDPAKGEDFGWERVQDAVIKPDSDAGDPVVGPAHAIQRRFVPGPAIARAHALYQQKRYDLIASEALIDVFVVKPLWSGTVTLQTTSDQRRRLVIAEYEEYLADDDRPYDRVPERKDRRLVFVEHVEI